MNPIFQKNTLDKVIYFKQIKVYPIIISLEDLCNFLEKGNFVEAENQPQSESNKSLTSAKNGTSSSKQNINHLLQQKKKNLK